MPFWSALLLWGVSFIATALLAPKPKLENARAQGLGDIDFPTAEEGMPVTKVWGRVNIKGPNTIWYGDFVARPMTQTVRVSLFKKKRQIIGYKYYVGFDLALCLGPAVTLHKIKVDKKELWSGTVNTQTTIAISKEGLFGGTRNGGGGGMSGTLEFYPGSFTQTHSAYVEGKVGQTIPNYKGVCHIVWRSFYIGTQASLRTPEFEVSCYTNSLGVSAGVNKIGDDINPWELVYDAMVSQFGGLGINPDLIDIASFIACATTVASEGNGMSMLLGSANEVKEVIVEALRQVDGIIYQDGSTGKVIAKNLRNDYDFDTIPSFNEDDISSVTNISKSMWSETFNQLRVIYEARAADYETKTAFAEDMSNVTFQGRTRPTEMNFPTVKTPSLANRIAARELSRLSVPLFSASMKMNRKVQSLAPGDVFKFSYAPFNIVDMVMRIQRFNLGRAIDGEISVDAGQDAYSISLPVIAEPDDTLWVAPATGTLEVTAALLIEAPFFILNQQEVLEKNFLIGDEGLLLLARNPGGSVVSFSILYANQPNSASFPFASSLYSIVNSETEEAEFNPSAVLSNSIGRNDGFVDSIVNVTIGSVQGTFATRALSVAKTGDYMMFIGQEIFIYDNVTDNGDGTFTLRCYRACLDTDRLAHSAGASVFFLDSIDAMVEDYFAIGRKVAIKPLSVSPNSQFSADDQDPFEITVSDRQDLPLPPDNLRIGTTRSLTNTQARNVAFTLNWNRRNRQTVSVLIQTDADETPEATTTYSVRWFDIGTSTYYNEQIVSGTTISYTIPLGAPAGAGEIRVRALRDGKYSRIMEWLPITAT